MTSSKYVERAALILKKIMDERRKQCPPVETAALEAKKRFALQEGDLKKLHKDFEANRQALLKKLRQDKKS